MALNRQKTYYSRIKEIPLTSGFSVDNEGVTLVSIRENGTQTVRPSAGSATSKTVDGNAVGTEVVAGFSYNTSLRAKSRVEQALVTVPTFTAGVGTVSIGRVNLVSKSVRVVVIAGNTALTVNEVTSVPGTVAAGTVSVNLLTGTLYFNVANTGASVLVTFRRVLSAIELALYVRESHVNANSSDFLGSVAVVRGNGDLFTDWFDTAQDYSTATKLYAGVNGLVTPLTNDGAGTPTYFAPIPGSELIQAPTIDDDANLVNGVTIGFKFNIG